MGGFGTVVDDGYGVSYIIVGEDDGKIKFYCICTMLSYLGVFFLQSTSVSTASGSVLKLTRGSLEMLS